jgi:hypothetical protein
MKKLSGGQFRPKTAPKPSRKGVPVEPPKATELRRTAQLLGKMGRKEFYQVGDEVFRVSHHKVESVGTRAYFDTIANRIGIE